MLARYDRETTQAGDERTVRDNAACKDSDPELFFPENYYGNQESVNEAKAICKECVVKELCLKTFFRERYGIYGGMTPSQRDTMRRYRLL